MSANGIANTDWQMVEKLNAKGPGGPSGGAVAYLNTTWLDQTNTAERTDVTVHGNAGGLLNTCLTYQYPWYGWTVTKEEAKIRLTLSDVEHMRKVAANDAKLKAAFQKIAPHIEVVVDLTIRTRNAQVILRGFVHVAWVLAVAGVVAWLSERAEFMPTLVAVVLAHSAWRAAEMETPHVDC